MMSDCAIGLGSRQENSKNRAPEPLPAHGAIGGAPESRVQLEDGLLAQRKNRPLCRRRCNRLPSTAPSFHPWRVGNGGGELTRNPMPVTLLPEG
jgi:hypothetical protein